MSALCFGGVAVTAVSVAQPPVVVATTPPPALSAVSLPVAWEAPELAAAEGSPAAELASAAQGGGEGPETEVAEALVAVVPDGSLAPDSGNLINYPLTTQLVTSPFGYRVHPIAGVVRFHKGVDFGAGCGVPVYASEAGTVAGVGWAGGYGNRIVVNHPARNGSSLSTTYNHLQGFAVATGAAVQRGQVIGFIGTTGSSTGCHLHYEVIVGGFYVDPMPWLNGKPSTSNIKMPGDALLPTGESPAPGASASTTPEPEVDVTPTPTASETPSPSETPSASETPAASDTPSASETPLPSETPAASETPLPSESPAASEPPSEPAAPATTAVPSPPAEEAPAEVPAPPPSEAPPAVKSTVPVAPAEVPSEPTFDDAPPSDR